MVDEQRKAAIARFRQQKNDFPEPLLNLLVRLKEMTLEGGFSYREAAATVTPGDGPKLHEKDGSTGELVVANRLVSAQLSPRDRLTPPCIQLVEAITTLYIDRTGTDLTEVNRELNALYQAASQHCEDTKKKHAEEALRAGRRAPTYAELRAQERTIAKLFKEIDAKDDDLARLRAQLTELTHGHGERDDRVAQLEDELAELHKQLDQALAELEQMRRRSKQLQQELNQTSDRLTRAIAENDQQQAHITDLQAQIDQAGGVRPDLAPDSAAHLGELHGGAEVRAAPVTDSAAGAAVLYQTPSTVYERWIWLGFGIAWVAAAVVGFAVWSRHSDTTTVAQGARPQDLLLLVSIGAFVLAWLSFRKVADLPERALIPTRITASSLRLGGADYKQLAWSKIGEIAKLGTRIVHSEHVCRTCGRYCEHTILYKLPPAVRVYALDGTTVLKEGPLTSTLDKDWDRFRSAAHTAAPHVKVVIPPTPCTFADGTRVTDPPKSKPPLDARP